MVRRFLDNSGLLVAALGRPELARGCAIPCATDVASSFLAARMMFGARHPAIPFLLLLAIADARSFGLGNSAPFFQMHWGNSC